MTRAASTKRSLLLALAVMTVVAGGVAWRLWFTGRVELEGTLREGTLRCDDECHFELVLEGPPATRVRAETCIMPDTLRDWPGRPVRLMIAGKPDGEGGVLASAILAKGGYFSGQKPSGGRPPACFVPPATR